MTYTVDKYCGKYICKMRNETMAGAIAFTNGNLLLLCLYPIKYDCGNLWVMIRQLLIKLRLYTLACT